ncbi:MAG: PEP-CTERM sorting domain-containing protein [Akkermansiaceae bacterium]
MSEVRFIAIPEPSSTALLGLGALGLMLRRKRS